MMLQGCGGIGFQNEIPWLHRGKGYKDNVSLSGDEQSQSNLRPM